MANNLNYQQARVIRGQSLKDVIADELIRGKGIGSAFSGAIGLKTQARIKGFKEKFDPLNVAKFLTFGSRLGPALYGRMFGRSQKDIEYFAGRAKSVGDRAKNMTGMSRKSSGDDTTGIKSGLSKILNFLEKSKDTDVKLFEKQNNFKEIKELEEKRRHNELMKALNSLIGRTQMNQIDSGGRGILGLFQDLKDKLRQKAEDKAIKAAETAAEKKAATAAIEKTVEKGVVTGAVESAAEGAVKDKVKTEVATKTAQKVLTKEAEEAAVKSAVKSTIAGGMKNYFLKNIPLGIGLLFSAGAGATRAVQGDWTGAAAEVAAGAASFVPVFGTAAGTGINIGLMARDVYKDVYKTNIEDDYRDDPEGTKRKVNFIMSIIQSSLNDIEKATPAPQAPEGYEINAEGGIIEAPKQSPKQNTPKIPLKAPKGQRARMAPEPEPVSEPPASQTLNSAIDTNNDLNIQSKTAQAETISTTTTVSTPVKTKEGFKPQIGFASVRNQDDTFQRLMMDSTRVV